MRNLKKVLALVLCLAMILSVMVTGVSAAFTDQDEIDAKHKEDVDVCVVLNIINGYPDGSFKPNGNITRAEMCKMICVLLNGGKEPTLGSTANSFTDVPATNWAAPYIASCVSQDIVAGIGDGKFNPNGNVTGSQAAKMLLIALGFNANRQNYLGAGWDINVNVDASARGFYVDLEDIDPSQALSREHAAEMIWNALNAYEVEYENKLVAVDGQLTTKEVVIDKVVGDNHDKITLLEDKYEAVTRTGILTDVNYDSDNNTYDTYVDGDWYFIKDEPVAIPAFDATTDYSALMGQEVKVIFTYDTKKDDYALLGMYATSQNKIVTGLFDDVDHFNGTKNPDGTFAKITGMTIDGKEYKFEGMSADPVYPYTFDICGPNGQELGLLTSASTRTSNTDLLQYYMANYFSFALIDNDKETGYDYLLVTPYAVGQVDKLVSNNLVVELVGEDYRINTDTFFDSQKLSYDLDKDDVTLYEGAEEDDYVVAIPSDVTVSGNVEFTKADIVSGAADRVKYDNANYVSSVQVDGSWYSVSNHKWINDNCKITLNDSYDFPTVNGFVFYADKTKNNISAENILFIEKIGKLTSGIADGVEAKVWFADGTKKIVTIDEVTVDGDIAWKDFYLDRPGKSYDIVQKNPASDELTNSEAEALITAYMENYMIFTYSESDGLYSIEPIYGEQTVKMYEGSAQQHTVTCDNMGNFDAWVDLYGHQGTNTYPVTIKDGKASGMAYDFDKDAYTTSDNTRFDAEAVIFVLENNGDVKIVSGSTVNNWKEMTGKDLTVVGLADKSSGNKYMAVGAIDLGAFTAKSDIAEYGFITDVRYGDDSNEFVEFEMWNGSDTVTIKAKRNDLYTQLSGDKLLKYQFISFNWKDEENSIADAKSVVVKKVDTNSAYNDATAITAFTSDDISFLNNQKYTDNDYDVWQTGQKTFDFADNYVVIGVDTYNGKGSDSNKLSTAYHTYNENKGVEEYDANAIAFVVKNGNDYEVEAVFIDVKGIMSDDKSGVKVTSEPIADKFALYGVNEYASDVTAYVDGTRLPSLGDTIRTNITANDRLNMTVRSNDEYAKGVIIYFDGCSLITPDGQTITTDVGYYKCTETDLTGVFQLAYFFGDAKVRIEQDTGLFSFDAINTSGATITYNGVDINNYVFDPVYSYETITLRIAAPNPWQAVTVYGICDGCYATCGGVGPVDEGAVTVGGYGNPSYVDVVFSDFWKDASVDYFTAP